MYPFYLGIDLHLKRTYVVLMDKEGEVLDKQHLKNCDIAKYISENVPHETYAVMEATRNWPFFYDLLGEHVERVELAHAKEVRSIAIAAVKTDQIDATVLAHLARLNFLPIAYAAPKEIRDLRQHLRCRDWLVGQRRRAKNRVHAVLAGYNLSSPVTDLFGRSGRKWLVEVAEMRHKPCPPTGMLREGEYRYTWGSQKTDYSFTGQRSRSGEFGLILFYKTCRI